MTLAWFSGLDLALVKPLMDLLLTPYLPILNVAPEAVLEKGLPNYIAITY